MFPVKTFFHEYPEYDFSFSGTGIYNLFGQVSNSLALTYPLVDLATVYTVYMMCPELPGHLIKWHVVNNLKIMTAFQYTQL